jgi:hypothetical protein
VDSVKRKGISEEVVDRKGERVELKHVRKNENISRRYVAK